MRRRKKASSAPLFIRGGVVTGMVTTPPGSAAALNPCGLRVAAQVRVWARHSKGHRIICSTRAQDLRRRVDPGDAASITQRIRARRRSIVQLHKDPDFTALARFSAKCRRVCRKKEGQVQ